MARLAAGFASGFRAQAARDRFLQAVAGGRFAAVGAVEREPPLQIADLSLQSEDQVHDDLWFSAGLSQKLLPAAAQLAHNASR